MGKDKKSKSEAKKAKIAEKKQKQEKKGVKKEKTKASRAGNDSDGEEDIDLDAVLAEYARQQELFLKVTESTCDPPSPRSSSTLVASPANGNELFLFGGEFFNGAVATFFNDLYVYLIDRNEWRLITSQNTPLPRSGHAWCRGGNAGSIFLFGGEFSSPKQNTFFHYSTFYRLEPSTREWTKLEPKGKGPPARSGHRMTYFKNYIILFGGFQDTSEQTKYLGDLWLYDTQNFLWHNPVLPPASQKPEPRSSFTFLPHELGAVLFGGYSRVKATVAVGKHTKGGGQSQRNVLKPLIHQDCFFLRISQPPADAPSNTPPTVRWERRKRPANTPNPPRAGATMTYHKGRGLLFGGVHDVEESEEGIDSEFFNNLFAWNIERNRYFPLTLRKPRNLKKSQPVERGGRKGRSQANEEELLRNLAALQTGKLIENADMMEIDKPQDEELGSNLTEMKMAMEFPHPRFNAQLAVQNDILYIYGGTFEKGDREYTLDELYAIDMGKLDGVKEIFRREPENWLGSDEESSEGEDISNGEDEEADDEEGEDGDAIMDDILMPEGGARDSKTITDVMNGSSGSASTVPSLMADEEPEAMASTMDDSVPHPRPFESRKVFFERTSHEWQEILMQNLRRKSIQPESLSMKEIKTKAFEISEEKWWDCREEIIALEEEQDDAGVGEVVPLADRGEPGVMGRRR